MLSDIQAPQHTVPHPEQHVSHHEGKKESQEWTFGHEL
jgi:hypothetical protein